METTRTTGACWICSRKPHAPTDHAYTSVAEARAWYARQPDALPPTVITVEGVTYTYAS